MGSRDTKSKTRNAITDEDRLYLASQWQLAARKFRKHKLAIVGMSVLILLYLFGLFCEIVSPYGRDRDNTKYLYCPPQRIRFFDNGVFHLRPFVYGLTPSRDPLTLRLIFEKDQSTRHPIFFFVHGDSYRFLDLIPMDLHLFGVKEGTLFLFGSDRLGRDVFSRTLYGTRMSLSIGLIGVALSFVLGCILGGLSGYYGGTVDLIIQRVIEFLLSIPTIPLWMALAASLPQDWPPVRIYFGITIILSFIGWCGLARVVRGKLLELREEDFVLAAKISGSSQGAIIGRHLLPSFVSYLVVSLTLAIPNMILGETSLSFLGIGLRPPVVSWGVLLKEAQNVRTVALHPWLLIPGLLVIVTVLAFNFLGDGLRDAADPYK